MGDVVPLEVETTLDLPPERILNGALEAALEVAVVIGVTKDGELYFASSAGHRGEVLLYIEQAKMELLGG